MSEQNAVTLGGMEFYRLCVRLKTNDEVARKAQEEIQARNTAAFKEAGLDPTKTYRLDEKTLTATEITPSGV
jgi:hypothetical protein